MANTNTTPTPEAPIPARKGRARKAPAPAPEALPEHETAALDIMRLWGCPIPEGPGTEGQRAMGAVARMGGASVEQGLDPRWYINLAWVVRLSRDPNRAARRGKGRKR